jgi:hypothetical protein
MMYAFHGWISIRMSPDPQDETESSGVIAQIQDWLNAIPEYGGCLAGWHVLNGSDMVVVQGLLNRPRGIDAALGDLYARVGAAAPGSYGLLYALDDDVRQDFTASSSFGYPNWAGSPVRRGASAARIGRNVRDALPIGAGKRLPRHRDTFGTRHRDRRVGVRGLDGGGASRRTICPH